MRKYLWIAVIALIACTVYFTSCEKVPKMMDTILPDAEQVETPEVPEPAPEMTATVEPPVETEPEPEMVEPEPEPKAEYMYWAEWGSGKIRRANLDGSNVQDIVDTGYYPVGITIDLSAGKLYWTDKTSNNHSDPNATNRVMRANLDGTNIEVLFFQRNTPDSLFTYFQIVLDPTEGKIYWTRPSSRSMLSFRI